MSDPIGYNGSYIDEESVLRSVFPEDYPKRPSSTTTTSTTKKITPSDIAPQLDYNLQLFGMVTALVGFVIIFVLLGPLTTLGIFLILWGNNIQQRDFQNAQLRVRESNQCD